MTDGARDGQVWRSLLHSVGSRALGVRTPPKPMSKGCSLCILNNV